MTYVDRLCLTGASGGARTYTATYTFHAVGPSSAPAQVKPIQDIASGTQVKHTDLGGAALYSLPALSPQRRRTTWSLTLTKVAAAAAPQAPGMVLTIGVDFPDGLVGAGCAAHEGWPLLLVDPVAADLKDAQVDYLHGVSTTVTAVPAVGGTTALPDSASTVSTDGLR